MTVPKVKLTYANESDPLIKQFIISIIEYATGRGKLERIYQDLKNRESQIDNIWEELLNSLSLNVECDTAPMSRIPKNGPVLLIANHPFGIVDGIIACHFASQVRERFSVLANNLLCNDPILADYLLPINFNENKTAIKTNIETRKLALQRLQKGEAIVIFPAGGVATAPNLFSKAVDLEWKRFVVKLIQKTETTIIPVYFHGQNSRLFQIASHIHLSLRLSLLLNEVRNKIGKSIKVDIRSPFISTSLHSIKDRKKLLEYLKRTVFTPITMKEKM